MIYTTVLIFILAGYLLDARGSRDRDPPGAAHAALNAGARAAKQRAAGSRHGELSAAHPPKPADGLCRGRRVLLLMLVDTSRIKNPAAASCHVKRVNPSALHFSLPTP
jgi:hypothetical protein